MYRTKTYIAGDWDQDRDAVQQLENWNTSKYWSLSFVNVHEFIQARDSSLNCSIKKSLKSRMDISKTFVLIVGEQTNSITAGSCQYCLNYNGIYGCKKGYSIDLRSYVKYECEKAKEAGINIIVLYKSEKVDRNKCPEIIRYIGIHEPMWYRSNDGKLYWNYEAVKKAFGV